VDFPWSHVNPILLACFSSPGSSWTITQIYLLFWLPSSSPNRSPLSSDIASLVRIPPQVQVFHPFLSYRPVGPFLLGSVRALWVSPLSLYFARFYRLRCVLLLNQDSEALFPSFWARTNLREFLSLFSIYIFCGYPHPIFFADGCGRPLSLFFL